MHPTVRRFCCVACFAFAWLAVKPASAAESQKLDTARVVVVGKVRAVFVDDSTAGKGYIIQLIEILVEKVEKAGPSEEPKPEKVLYACTLRFRDVPGVIPPGGGSPGCRADEGGHRAGVLLSGQGRDLSRPDERASRKDRRGSEEVAVTVAC